MAKKKKSGGGGGGEQQPKPADEAVADEKTPENKDKAADKGKKPPPPVVTAVLKVDMHCDGCVKRIRASVRHYPGVQGVAVDVARGTMTVVGRVDAKKLRDRVANKTKKKVEVVVVGQNKGKDDDKKQQNQDDVKARDEHGKQDDDLYWLDKDKDKKQPKEDKGSGGGEGKAKEDKGSAGGGDKGKGGNKDNTTNNKKPPAVPVVGTVVLKIGAMGLHCDGCINRVRTKLFKIRGVEQVAMDVGKNQVTVTGTMDVKALPGRLQKKLRRPVDVVPANKENKEKEKSSSKQEGGCSKDKDKDAATKALTTTTTTTAEMLMWKTAFYDYDDDQHPLLSTDEFIMLSDENPNACSVM